MTGMSGLFSYSGAEVSGPPLYARVSSDSFLTELEKIPGKPVNPPDHGVTG